MTADTSSVALPKLLGLGLCLALLSILLGFGLGVTFGAQEEALKRDLASDAEAVLTTVYQGDAEAKSAVVAKSWEYLKRAHLHWGAIGSAAVASILALIVLGQRGRTAQLTALAFGLGAVLYGLFWLKAGFAAPGLGSTGAAKEAYAFLGLPGGGLSALASLSVLVQVVRATLTSSGARN